MRTGQFPASVMEPAQKEAMSDPHPCGKRTGLEDVGRGRLFLAIGDPHPCHKGTGLDGPRNEPRVLASRARSSMAPETSPVCLPQGNGARWPQKRAPCACHTGEGHLWLATRPSQKNEPRVLATRVRVTPCCFQPLTSGSKKKSAERSLSSHSAFKLRASALHTTSNWSRSGNAGKAAVGRVWYQ